MADRRPNFIIFMTDQQRADHLGCYGNKIVRTKNIDRLAENGLRFDNFFVANPICQPNRIALATGQMSSVNGCRQNGIPMGLDSTSYASVLRGQGYRTGLVGKAHFQNVSDIPARPRTPWGHGMAPDAQSQLALKTQRSGPLYEQEKRGSWAADPDRALTLPYYGFDHVRLCIGHGDQVEGHYSGWLHDRLGGSADPRGREKAQDDGRGPFPQVWRTALPESLYPTSFVGEEACAFLEAADDQPFLLLVSFPDPHHPFTPPAAYFDMYDPASIDLPASFDQPIHARRDLPEYVQKAYQIGDENPDAYWPFHADPELAKKIIALNYGAITMIDDWIGRIMDCLAATGKQDETVTCFMSDHGDYMGDYGTLLKHGVHSMGLIRVPLIWHDPQAGERGVLSVQGSAIDFAPTLLQRAGLQVPVGMQGRDLLDRESGDLPVLIEDAGIGVYRDPEANTSIRTLVHKGWRLSIFEGSQMGELYDLGSDPHEMDNLWEAPQQSGKKLEMLQLLIDRNIQLRDKSLLATNQA